MISRFRAVVIASALAVMALGGTTAQAHHHKQGTNTGSTQKIKVTGGDTTLTLNDAAKSGLAAQGITVAPIAPATSASAGSLTFPIAGGKLKSTNFFGAIGHKGGVTLTKGDNTVKVKRLVLVNGPRGASIWAFVGRAHKSHKFAKRGHRKLAKAAHHGKRRGARHRFRWHWEAARVLDLSNVTHSVQDGKQVFTADAALSQKAAKFLNRKLGTTLFTTGAIGTVKVTATTG
jgi:hypothetical protein